MFLLIVTESTNPSLFIKTNWVLGVSTIQYKPDLSVSLYSGTVNILQIYHSWRLCAQNQYYSSGWKNKFGLCMTYTQTRLWYPPSEVHRIDASAKETPNLYLSCCTLYTVKNKILTKTIIIWQNSIFTGISRNFTEFRGIFRNSVIYFRQNGKIS